MRESAKGTIALITFAFFNAFGNVMLKCAFEAGVSFSTFQFYSNVLTTIILLTIQPWNKIIKKEALALLTVIIVLEEISWKYAVVLVEPGFALVMFRVVALITATLIGHFYFQEEIIFTPYAISCFCIFSGLVFTLTSVTTSIFGLILIFFAAVCVVVYVSIQNKAKLNELVITFTRSFTMTLIFTPIWLYEGSSFPSGHQWLLLLIAAFANVCYILLLFYGSKLIDVHLVAILQSLNIPSGYALQLLLLGNFVTWRQYIGAAILFCGVVIYPAFKLSRSSNMETKLSLI